MFWWDAKDRVHEHVWPHVRSVEENQIAIHRLNLLNAKLYSNRELQSLDWNSGQIRQVSHSPVSNTRENLIANAVDSITAMIGRHMPKVTSIVSDADFTVERTARLLDRALYADFIKFDVYGKMQRVFNDCLWAQIGALKLGIDNNEIFIERVMPDEIIVDQRECISSSVPLQIHQRRVVPKVVLKAKFPQFADRIEACENTWVSYRRPGLDNCVVVESWVLDKPGIPGRHTITIQTATLLDKPYKRKRFPFIFLRYLQLPSGFYGRSLVEYGSPYQARQDELNRVITESQDLMCRPRIVLYGNSKVVESHITNEIASFIRVRGTQKPEQLHWNAVVSDLYNERERNRATFFEDLGISKLFAQSSPPPGVRFDSSKALREFSFTQNERHQPQSRMLEQAYLEVAEHLIELNQTLSKKGSPRKTFFIERSITEEIDWRVLNTDDIHYTLRLAASSVINMSPGAREDQLRQWANDGLISPEKFRALLDHPDLEEESSLLRASLDNAKAVVSMLDKADQPGFELPVPDLLENLALSIETVHRTYLRRLTQKNVPEEIIAAYRDWLAEARSAFEQAQAQQTAAMEQVALNNAGTPSPAVATTQFGIPVNSFNQGNQ